MKRLKIGITGQDGFIGQCLHRNLSILPEEFECINYKKEFFNDQDKLIEFVSKCDVIIHLAAMNRHHEAQVIYDTNIELTQKLIAALKANHSNAYVLFSSSSQEEKDNHYGKSKKHCRELLSNWASKSDGKFSGMIIPNVFGPFGHPYYNSFIATFSHQLINNEQPRVDLDSDVKLIYVEELAKIILSEVKSGTGNEMLVIPYTYTKKVSEILEQLRRYKSEYIDYGVIPKMNDLFEINLFNTFRSFIDPKNYFPVKFTKHIDSRGSFVEVIRLNNGGQVSFSTTVAGITRGNHFHTRKIERFAVIKGKAQIQLRKIGTDQVLDFYLDGNEPTYVDMPIWYTHNIKNIGDDDLYTIFWINEFYNPQDSDTYFEVV